jgi:hypothetical protein
MTYPVLRSSLRINSQFLGSSVGSDFLALFAVGFVVFVFADAYAAHRPLFIRLAAARRTECRCTRSSDVLESEA